MTEAASQVQISINDEMWLGRLVDNAGVDEYVFTEIQGIMELGFPDQVPEDIDVTHQGSPGRTRETQPGLLPVADHTQEKQYWPLSDGDIVLEELAAKTAAGEREIVLIEFNIDGGARRTYRAYINSFIPGGSVGDKRMVSVNTKILDRQAANLRVIV